MKINCKKIALLVCGVAILGGAGFSACCFAQDVQTRAPIQRVCESPFGPVTPMFQDVKQIYLLWDYKAGQPELLSEPLREEALKKEVLAYMQTYLTPCSKSKEIKIMARGDSDTMRNQNNLIAYVVSAQYSDFKKDESGNYKNDYLNTITIRAGFYRAGTYMAPPDLLSIIGNVVKLEGNSDDVEGRVKTIISTRLGIRGRYTMSSNEYLELLHLYNWTGEIKTKLPTTYVVADANDFYTLKYSFFNNYSDHELTPYYNQDDFEFALDFENKPIINNIYPTQESLVNTFLSGPFTEFDVFFSSVANIKFEQGTLSDSQITIGNLDISYQNFNGNTHGAGATYNWAPGFPYPEGRYGDVWFNQDMDVDDNGQSDWESADATVGSKVYLTVIHELGHAIGLTDTFTWESLPSG